MKEVESTELSLTDFEKSFGEDFSQATDIDTWRIGEDIAPLLSRFENELTSSQEREKDLHQKIRTDVFEGIRKKAFVTDAGLHTDAREPGVIEKIHHGFLFNGSVTACGTSSAVFETVPLSITQLGICLVNYQGQQGSYSHRLFRKDLQQKGEHEIDLIYKRKADEHTGDKRKQLSNHAVRGVKAFAERAILLEKKDSQSQWILGYGSPAPFELMTGFWASQSAMKDRSIALMMKMIEHKKFIYIQDSEKSPELWTIGNALEPFEYILIDTMEDGLLRRVELGGTRNQFRDDYKNFASKAGSQIAMGLYRVSRLSSPKIFYCHVDYARIAPLIVIADSIFQMHKGIPALLDLAGNICKSAFGKNDFVASINQAQANIYSKIRKKVSPPPHD